MTERSIPHLRDIFGFHGGWSSGGGGGGGDVSEQLGRLKLDKHQGQGSGGRDPDSAISSIGSTSEDESESSRQAASKSSRRRQQRSRRGDNNSAKTLTERDVKHLERHLSMKKTIRKKIMRDLQQAFVEDPTMWSGVGAEAAPDRGTGRGGDIGVHGLSFGGGAGHKAAGHQEPSFLDMLRGAAAPAATPSCPDDGDSGHGSPTRELSAERRPPLQDQEQDPKKAGGFWRRFTIKGRNKR